MLLSKKNTISSLLSLKKVFLLAGVMLFLLFSTTSCSNLKVKRCPIPNCHTKMMHKHESSDFRGRPWYCRNQNPKIGQLHPDIVHDDGKYKPRWGYKKKVKFEFLSLNKR